MKLKHDFLGEESDQSDADSKPGQENQGRGGSEASLDLPEREGGLCIPQVRDNHASNTTNNFYPSLGKKLWTAWRNSMHEENWKAQYWRQCWSLGTSQVRWESNSNNDKHQGGVIRKCPPEIFLILIFLELTFIYYGFSRILTLDDVIFKFIKLN